MLRKLYYSFKDCNYPDEVKQIVLAGAKIGYFMTPLEAENLWKDYSNELCAGWLGLPTEEKLIKLIKQLIEDPEEIEC